MEPTEGKVGYATRHAVCSNFVEKYDVHVVGSRVHSEYGIPIPAEKLEATRIKATSGAEPSGEDSTEDTFEPEGLALPVKPRDLLPEQWQTILARYPSKAAAARSLPTDPQTITKHLPRLNIEERWTGA